MRMVWRGISIYNTERETEREKERDRKKDEW